jgi:hypothetical protein
MPARRPKGRGEGRSRFWLRSSRVPFALALLAGARDARRRQAHARFAHGFAIGRLVDIQYTAASAVSPCTKIATVAHAGLAQSYPNSSSSRASGASAA